MKKQYALISILTLTLLAAALIMSCTSGPSNSNTAVNTNQKPANAANQDVEVALDVSQDPCQDPNLGTKKDKLKKAVEDKIKGDVTGKNPLAEQYNRNFYLDVAEGTGADARYVIATVSGAIQGRTKMEELADFIEDFVKTNCNIKVVFKATDKKASAYPPSGFEWCEAPMIACPGGYCAQQCDFSGNVNSNMNTNTNMNTNRP